MFDDDSGNTTRTRDRECVKVDERECDGESTQTQHCEDADKCPGKYDVIRLTDRQSDRQKARRTDIQTNKKTFILQDSV